MRQAYDYWQDQPGNCYARRGRPASTPRGQRHRTATHPDARPRKPPRLARTDAGTTTERRNAAETGLRAMLQIAAATAEEFYRRRASRGRPNDFAEAGRRHCWQWRRRLVPLAFGGPLTGSESTRRSSSSNVATPTGDASIPGESRPTLGALHPPRPAGWTIVRANAGASPKYAWTVSYLGRATVSDCRT